MAQEAPVAGSVIMAPPSARCVAFRHSTTHSLPSVRASWRGVIEKLPFATRERMVLRTGCALVLGRHRELKVVIDFLTHKKVNIRTVKI